jgi:hypothetical protein
MIATDASRYRGEEGYIVISKVNFDGEKESKGFTSRCNKIEINYELEGSRQGPKKPVEIKNKGSKKEKNEIEEVIKNERCKKYWYMGSFCYSDFSDSEWLR